MKAESFAQGSPSIYGDEARVLVESVISQLQERKRKYLRQAPSSLEL